MVHVVRCCIFCSHIILSVRDHLLCKIPEQNLMGAFHASAEFKRAKRDDEKSRLQSRRDGGKNHNPNSSLGSLSGTLNGTLNPLDTCHMYAIIPDSGV